MVSDDQEAERPEGRLVIVPIPVAPVVACFIGVKTELIHRDEEETVDAVFKP